MGPDCACTSSVSAPAPVVQVSVGPAAEPATAASSWPLLVRPEREVRGGGPSAADADPVPGSDRPRPQVDRVAVGRRGGPAPRGAPGRWPARRAAPGGAAPRARRRPGRRPTVAAPSRRRRCVPPAPGRRRAGRARTSARGARRRRRGPRGTPLRVSLVPPGADAVRPEPRSSCGPRRTAEEAGAEQGWGRPVRATTGNRSRNR